MASVIHDRARDPWPWRLRTGLILGAVVAVLVGWVSVAYFGRSVPGVETYSPADGWCDAPSEGLGVHCFGDFAFPRTIVEGTNTWGLNSDGSLTNPYTALGMVPHLLTDVVAGTPLGVRGSLFIYLLFLAVSLLVPALWVIVGHGGRAPPRDWLPVLLLGVASGPFLMTMDRGNSIGFVVPFLLLFCLFLRDDPVWVAPVATIAASAVRPQFVLLALGLVAVRRWRAAAYAIAGSVALNALAFAVWPGGPVNNIKGWLGDLSRFQDHTDVAADIPVNVSAAHAVASVGAWLSHAPGVIGGAGQWLESAVREHSAVPGLILVAIVAIVAVVFRGRLDTSIVVVTVLALPALAQGVAYSYGLVFALVLGALMLGPAGPGALRPDAAGHRSLFAGDSGGVPLRVWKWAALVVLVLSVVPFVLSIDTNSQSVVKGQLGLAWLVIVIAGLVVAIRQALLAVRA